MKSPLPPLRWNPRALLRWAVWLGVVAGLSGSAAALFLWGLDSATRARFESPWLLYLLPVFGLGMGWLYHRYGAPAERGNNVVIDAIHDRELVAPRRMAPMILLTTVLTHLGGGSAGREGTAVQMGGSIAGWLAKTLRVDGDNRRLLHLAGVAAGFGAVFGTPWAGALFALEVPVAGRIQWRGWLPCLVAAWAGDYFCRAWGIHHTDWPALSPTIGPWGSGSLLPDFGMLAKLILCAVLFGLVALVFARSLHFAGRQMARLVTSPPWRPFVGGLLIILLVHLLDSRAYLGLGVWSSIPGDPTLTGFFAGDGSDSSSWAWKMLFTVVTLAAGFKGGEVTPLFFIGAGLGHALSGPMGLPVDLLAALGMVAVFAAAAKTPWACAVMGAELFGLAHAPVFLLVALLATRASGVVGIYHSQQRGN